MTKHTSEPWPFFIDWAEPSSPNTDGEPIVRLGCDDYQRARYCVNACQGASNGQLAMTSVSGAILMLQEAEQQRDDLLAALDATVKAWELGEDIFGGMMKAKAAIAKAKGIDHE